jgi:hypothetical protein
VKLPQHLIATKLYAIFALLASITVALAVAVAYDARQHAALTEEFESAFAGAINVLPKYMAQASPSKIDPREAQASR